MALILIVFALGNKRIVPLETAKPPRVTLGTAFVIHISCKLSVSDEERGEDECDRAQQFDENVE